MENQGVVPGVDPTEKMMAAEQETESSSPFGTPESSHKTAAEILADIQAGDARSASTEGIFAPAENTSPPGQPNTPFMSPEPQNVSSNPVSIMPEIQRNPERISKEYARQIIQIVQKNKENPCELQEKVSYAKKSFLKGAFNRTIGEDASAQGEKSTPNQGLNKAA